MDEEALIGPNDVIMNLAQGNLVQHGPQRESWEWGNEL